MSQQRPEHRVAQFLDTNGDGSGTTNATGLIEHYFKVMGELLVNRPVELGTENY